MNHRPSIVAVDNFYKTPGAVRAAALADKLEAHPERHKGLRGTERPISPEMKVVLASLLNVEAVTDGYCVFQLCVGGDPVVFHADPQSYAAVVYLTENAPIEAGTSFYRSKTTGLYTTVGMNLDEEVMTFRDKFLDPTAWEEVDRVGNRFNRLVVWDGKLIHGASCYFGTGPSDGRLFEMFFFSVR